MEPLEKYIHEMKLFYGEPSTLPTASSPSHANSQQSNHMTSSPPQQQVPPPTVSAPILDQRERNSVLYTLIKKEKVDIVAVIFSNIRQLLDCNLVILEILQENSIPVINRKEIIINFNKVLPMLKFYGDYIRNVENSRQLLKRLEADIRFTSFIRAIELQEESNGLKLESHLAKPWQRIMKYELLLREMRERADSKEEQLLIDDTIDVIREINTGLNKLQAASENQKLLIEKQKYYGLKDIVAPARYFVRDGTMKVITSTKKRELSFLLCNDVLFYGRKSGTLTTAQFKSCDVHQILVVRYPETESKTFVLRISLDEGKLTDALSQIAIVFQVEASTEEECDKWLQDIISLKNDDKVLK